MNFVELILSRMERLSTMVRINIILQNGDVHYIYYNENIIDREIKRIMKHGFEELKNGIKTIYSPCSIKCVEFKEKPKAVVILPKNEIDFDNMTMRQIKTMVIGRRIAAFGGDKAKAARSLKIGNKTIYRWI